MTTVDAAGSPTVHYRAVDGAANGAANGATGSGLAANDVARTGAAGNGGSSNGVAPYRGGGFARAPRMVAPRRQSRLPVEAPATATDAPATDEVVAGRASCTLAQMRRFIKSRPYVPVHELRRRFEIEGIEDEVSPMSTGKGTLFVGLPELEAGFLGELVKAGEVGCELLLDPTSPAVVGVFPMRPVARQ